MSSTWSGWTTTEAVSEMLTNGMRPVHPGEMVHPGEILRKDDMVPRGRSATALARALRVTPVRRTS